MRRAAHRAGIAVTIAVVLCAPRVCANPDPVPAGHAVHVLTPSHLVSDGGTDLRLPPSYVIDEPTWSRLDVEVRRLQDAEHRLTAENASLRKSASGWRPGWKTISLALAAGAVGGWYLHRL